MKRGSIQETFLPLREVSGPYLRFEQAGRQQYRCLLEVTGMHFGLLTPEQQQELFEAYLQLVRSLSFPWQLLIRVQPLDLAAYLRYLPEARKEDTSHLAVGQLLASHHRLFLESLTQDKKLLERRFYVVLAADESERMGVKRLRLRSRSVIRRKREALNFTQAQQQLQLRSELVSTGLQQMGLHVREVRDMDLVHLYQSTFGSWARRMPLTETALQATGVSGRGQSLEDMLAPEVIRVEKEHLCVDEQEYLCVLVVRGWPQTVVPGFLQPLVLLDEMMDIAFHQRPWSQPEALGFLRRKQAQYQSSMLYARQKGKQARPLMESAVKALDTLVEKVAGGEERLHEQACHLLVRASSREALEERVQRVEEVLYATCYHRPYRMLYEQERGFKACLPGNMQTRDATLLDSSAVAAMFPFFSNLIYRPSPTSILEGVTPNHEPVVLDRWELSNYNRFILAPSGSGKSYKSTLDILRLFMMYQAKAQREGIALQECFQVIVLDPDREYKRRCEELAGQWVQLAPGSEHHLNPFDLPQIQQTQRAGAFISKEDVLASHIQTLHLFLDAMLAHHSPDNPDAALSVEEKSLLDVALYETYRRVGISADRDTHHHRPPLLRDLYHVLESGDCGEDPTRLAQRLRRFVSGSLSGLFADYTNVQLSNPFIVFDVKELDGELRTLALMLVSNLVWSRSFASTIPRLFVIDELATLYRYRSGKRFAEELFRRARKQYLGVTGITQDPALFQDGSLLSNCDVHILMKQDHSTLNLVEQLYRLSPQEVALLRNLRQGEALMLVDGKRMHVRFLASALEHQLASTQPSELAEQEAQEQKQGSSGIQKEEETNNAFLL